MKKLPIIKIFLLERVRKKEKNFRFRLTSAPTKFKVQVGGKEGAGRGGKKKGVRYLRGRGGENRRRKTKVCNQGVTFFGEQSHRSRCPYARDTGTVLEKRGKWPMPLRTPSAGHRRGRGLGRKCGLCVEFVDGGVEQNLPPGKQFT